MTSREARGIPHPKRHLDGRMTEPGAERQNTLPFIAIAGERFALARNQRNQRKQVNYLN
jgi:hypothetical protein